MKPDTKKPNDFRYAVVSRRLWNDASFRALSAPAPCGQALFQRLLTAPEASPIPGLIPAGRAALAEALRWTPEAFDDAFAEVSAQGMAKADWEARLVWLPKAFEHNKPASTNQVKAWRKAFNDVPDSPLKEEAKAALRALCVSLGKPWIAALNDDDKASPKSRRMPSVKASPKPSPMASAKASPDPSPIQIPTQNQNQTPTHTPSLALAPLPPRTVRHADLPEPRWEAAMRGPTPAESACLAAFDAGYATTSPGKRALGVKNKHADLGSLVADAESIGDPPAVFREAGAELGRRVAAGAGTPHPIRNPWTVFCAAPIGSWATSAPQDERSDRIAALAAESKQFARLADEALVRGDKAGRADLNAKSEAAAQACERLKREARS